MATADRPSRSSSRFNARSQAASQMPLPSVLPPSANRGRKKAQALIRLTETFGKPLRPEPTSETQAEARVRVIEDTIERLKLMEAAGLRVVAANGIEHPYHLRRVFECELMEARRCVRFERGDF